MNPPTLPPLPEISVPDDDFLAVYNIERFSPDPNGGPAASNPSELQRQLAEISGRLGFCRVGSAAAEPFTEASARFRAWLDKGFAGTMEPSMLSMGNRCDPRELHPWARSLIVLGLSIPRNYGSSPPDGAGRIARYAQGLDYHIALRGRMRRLSQQLANLAGRPILVRPCVDTAPLLEREAARRAGIGFVGKSTMLLAPGVGPWLVLGVMLVDLDLESSASLPASCGDCRACLDACPTGALTAPYQLDARRCISCLTIEHRGQIPLDLRDRMGTQLFGCDRCQEACPQGQGNHQGVSDFDPRPVLEAPQLRAWLEMTATDYRRLAKRTVLRRTDRAQLRRNAIIALGNQGDASSVPTLATVLTEDPDATLRGHAAWALGRLDTPEARHAVEQAELRERDDQVLQEIRAALGR